jgi:transcription elongation GreA/GreB family factor
MPATVARSRGAMHAGALDKSHIIEKIVATLRQEFEGSMRSARAAHAEATHEQNKAENKYDTRGLEASYLAHGQSRQAAELLQTIHLFENLPVTELAAGEPIGVGTLVELEQEGERTFYFIGPGGGGTEVELDGATVLVLTPQSPMGGQLVGQTAGAHLEIRVGRNVDAYRIVSAR